MKVFKASRKNDAWGTIRGFVYQVNVTIQRWLELKADEMLELERGEDIDIIQPDIEVSYRLLEQIKVRESNLTLRSESALSSLANFYKHTQENPEINLKFRYLTNAKISKERKLTTKVKIPLISAWKKIFEDNIKGRELEKYLKVIKELINSSEKPQKTSDNQSRKVDIQSWTSFKDFVRNSSKRKFLEFIKSVEWATEQEDPTNFEKALQKKIIGKFNVSENQAVNIYQSLFYNVFNVITKPGIKRLSISDLDTLINNPNFVDQKAVDKLFDQLKSHESRIQGLEIGYKETGEKIDTLKKKIDERNYVLDLDYVDLHEACNKTSIKNAAQIIDNQKTIPRLKFDDKVDNFLIKHIRYAIVTGISGAGKSIAVADQANKLIEKGWTVLLFAISPGDTFNFTDFVPKQIKEALNPEPMKLEWSQIIKPWISEDKSFDSKGLIILLDGLETSSPAHIVKELEFLHNSLGDVSLDKIKVILSIRDFDFQNVFQRNLNSFLVEVDNWRESNRAYKLLEISNFTSDELDEALLKIGGLDLLSIRNQNNEFDSHILSLRDLLKHPGTFEHFSNLYQSNKIQLIQEETWSSLIGKRIEYVLRDISSQVNRNIEEIRDELVKFTKICRSWNSREFSLELSVVRSYFPEWFDASEKNSKTQYSVLISSGMLFEQSVSTTEKYISFRITDAGAYLLSFVLEDEIEKADFEHLQNLCKDFLSGAWEFAPMLDAILAFIDRKCISPYNERILTLLKTIVNSHQYRTLFSLMRPTVLGAVFKLIRQNKTDDNYDYFEAARIIRFSIQNVSLIKKYLVHSNPDIQRLAINMAGIYKATELSAILVKLLIAKDENVKSAAYQAIGKIGKPAIDNLLFEIRNPKNSTELKASCIYALNNIGFLTEEISKTLLDVFSNEVEDKPLLRASLLASAHLCDPHQIENALNLLSNKDKEIALASAKYLTEVPDKSSWNKLWSVLQTIITWDDYDKDFHYYFLVNQIIAALIKIDRQKAESELYKMIREGLSGDGKLGLKQSERLVKKHDLAFGYPLVLDFMIKELESPPPQKFAHSLSEMLGSTWKPESLKKLIEKASELKSENISISEIFIKAIAANMPSHDIYPMAEGLNRVSDLKTLIKCHALDFLPTVKPLFDKASELSTREFCKYFWVIGDTTVEDNLIQKFENIPETETSWRTFNSILKALGTCGTERGAGFILSYMKNYDQISLAFPRESLFPLLLRKFLLPEKLSEFCQNNKNNAVGRAAGLFALADFSASEFVDLFIETAKDSEDLVQRNAVRALGFTKSQSAANFLKKILSSKSSLGLKGCAARALMHLNLAEAVSEIEDVLEDCDEKHELAIVNILDALSFFQSPSSIPIILNRLESAELQNRGYYLQALGSFISHPEAARRVSQELERGAESTTDFFNEQSLLISGVTLEWNEKYFNKILGYLRNGRLSENSRIEICRNMLRVFKNRKSDKNVLARIIEILLSDYNLDIRDRALNSLTLFPANFCRKIYSWMIDAPNTHEWKRACAVESLGFWKSDPAEIKKMQYDKELLVRRAANFAIENKTNLKVLQYHLSEFQNKNGLARLSAYLCLADNGNLSTIWKLHNAERKKSLNFTYIKNLLNEINERRNKDIKEMQRKQNKQQDERGIISFD